MNAIINRAKLVAFPKAEEQVAATEAVRYAQSTMLSELPGAAVAFVTLVYVISSFLQLL